ncbi:MerR family transcriptional regulator [Lacrimispora sp.]|jgi:DNA-binding transcriptional MerR regulator|uniref:MerR family transcriptional regulator n=1 Tax=Lacrimispora sp. TaxID=2719234 RepID=UPI0029E3680E|nr:hypothetical protein [Lacrimispora sp.]
MKKYSIGEVSLRLGLSRDTLRFYEKKGIIQPDKEDNGYRSYTYEDISRLLDIMYYRRLHFSLEDIERFLYKSSLHSSRSMIQEKITEEKEQLELHRQSLMHLNQLKTIYDNVKQGLNRYQTGPMLSHYKINDSEEINDLGIPDLCAPFQEYEIKEKHVKRKEDFFLLSEETASAMHMNSDLKKFPILKWETCVYTVIDSDSLIPDEDKILAAVNWGKKQGYTLTGTAYCGAVTGYAPKPKTEEETEEDFDSAIHYLELYLPVST